MRGRNDVWPRLVLQSNVMSAFYLCVNVCMCVVALKVGRSRSISRKREMERERRKG